MKKTVKIFLLLFVGILTIIGVAGCNGDTNKEISTGAFYSLQEAYDNGWLTQEDLKSIAYYQSGGRSGNKDIMDEDYRPMPKRPAELDDETKLAIKQAYYKRQFPDEDWSNVSPEPFYPYYGCYHKCVVISFPLFYDSMMMPEISMDVEIGGVKFWYSDSVYLCVWRQ